MLLLRKHQKRLVDQVLENVELSVLSAMDPATKKVTAEHVREFRTLVIAPWCKKSGKTGVVEYLSTLLIHQGFRLLVYCANDDHMRERYASVKKWLSESWCIKKFDDEGCQFITTDTGGIAYFISNDSNLEILTSMVPYIHVLLVEEGDFISERSVTDTIKQVPTALVIGTRRGSSDGLIKHLISEQTPHSGITINELTEDDLLAEGYDRSLHDTLVYLRQSKEEIRKEARELSIVSKTAVLNHDESSPSGNKTEE